MHPCHHASRQRSFGLGQHAVPMSTAFPLDVGSSYGRNKKTLPTAPPSPGTFSWEDGVPVFFFVAKRAYMLVLHEIASSLALEHTSEPDTVAVERAPTPPPPAPRAVSVPDVQRVSITMFGARRVRTVREASLRADIVQRVDDARPVANDGVWDAFAAWLRRDAQKTTAVVVGPRGSGKTMGVRHHAHACGFDVVEVDVLESAEVEGHVRELCRKDIGRPSLLLVDDVDEMDARVVEHVLRTCNTKFPSRRLVCTMTDAPSAKLRDLKRDATLFALKQVSVAEMCAWARDRHRAAPSPLFWQTSAEMCAGDMRQFTIRCATGMSSVPDAVYRHPFAMLRDAYHGTVERVDSDARTLLFHNYPRVMDGRDMAAVADVAHNYSDLQSLSGAAEEMRTHVLAHCCRVPPAKRVRFDFPQRTPASEALWKSFHDEALPSLGGAALRKRERNC